MNVHKETETDEERLFLAHVRAIVDPLWRGQDGDAVRSEVHTGAHWPPAPKTGRESPNEEAPTDEERGRAPRERNGREGKQNKTSAVSWKP